MGIKEWFLKPKEEERTQLSKREERDEYESSQRSKRFLERQALKEEGLAENQKARLEEVNKKITEYESKKAELDKKKEEDNKKKESMSEKDKEKKKKESERYKRELKDLKKEIKSAYKTKRQNNTQRVVGFRGGLDMLGSGVRHNPLELMGGSGYSKHNPFDAFKTNKTKSNGLDWFAQKKTSTNPFDTFNGFTGFNKKKKKPFNWGDSIF